jgi:hypothetical protein
MGGSWKQTSPQQLIRGTHTHTDIQRYSTATVETPVRHERGGHGQPDRHVGWEHLEKSVWIDWRGGWRIILKFISGQRLLGRYGLQLIIYISVSQFVSRPDYRLSGMRSSAIFFILSRKMLGQYFKLIHGRFLRDPFQLLSQWSSCHWATHCLKEHTRNWCERAMHTGAVSEDVSGECQSNTMQRDTN